MTAKEKKIKVRFMGRTKSFFIFMGNSILVQPFEIIEISEKHKTFFEKNRDWEIVKNGNK